MAAAKELGLEFQLVKVTDINVIMSFGIMMTPGLAVDGVVRSSGRLLTVAEIRKLLV